MVLVVVEPAVTRDGQIKIAIPVMRRLGTCLCAEYIKGSRALERVYAHAVIHRLDIHAPVAGMGTRVVVTVVDQGLDCELNRSTRAHELISHVGRVGSMLHPHSFLEQGVGTGKRPDGHRTFQSEGFDESVSLRIERASGPAVRAQRIGTAVVVRHFIQLCHKQRAPERRLERGYQQPVIAARQESDCGAGSEPADPVGHDPFTLFCG